MRPPWRPGEPEGSLPPSTLTRFTRGAVLLGTLLSVTACGADEARISAVYGEPRSDRLELGIETCNAVLSADVQEATSEIRILVTRQDDPGRDDDDCADHIFVSLAEPFGNRVVVDESTGDRLDVQPPD